jgi:hypothetical protein
MLENKMKTYLGENYSENSIRNFLKYWQMPSEPREEHDLDCIYLDGDLNADTLISFWTPLKWVLQILNPDESFYKTNPDVGDPFLYLKKLENDLDKYLPQNDELTKLICKLASLAETRANVFRLPDREMNCSRYRYFYDEIPATLYNIFERGRFHCYFKDERDVRKWILEQDLQVAFKDGNIQKTNLRPLLPGLPLYAPIWPETREDVKTILEEMIYILEARYKLMCEKELEVA